MPCRKSLKSRLNDKKITFSAWHLRAAVLMSHRMKALKHSVIDIATSAAATATLDTEDVYLRSCLLPFLTSRALPGSVHTYLI